MFRNARYMLPLVAVVLMLLPAADWTNRSRWLKALALLLLAASVFSAFYASANPWTHPWLYNYWTYLQWVPA